MKVLAALLIVLAIALPARAEPADIDAIRLQAAEAAIRAGANRPHQMIIRNTPRATATETDRATSLHMSAQPREFPVPPRMDALPSARGVQAMIAASTPRNAATPASAAKPANVPTQSRP